MTVSLFHERWRRQVSLLAVGALDDDEEARTRRHVESCDACRGELQSLRAMLETLPEPDIPLLPLGRLVAQVEARVVAAHTSLAARLGWKVVALPIAAAAVLAAYFIVPPLVERAKQMEVARVAPHAASRQIELSDDSLRRLERNLSREHAARYLSEAQDVLVTVADALPRCRREGHMDVGDEAQRSRELLESRALLVDDSDALAGVRPVLDDVDNVLREVAALDKCARRADIEAIGATLERHRLLMKMDLMARELAG